MLLSLKQRRPLMVWITLKVELKNYKKEGENRNEEERKRGSFSKRNLCIM